MAVATRVGKMNDFAALCAVDSLAHGEVARARALRRALAANECLVAWDGTNAVGFAIADRSFYDHGFLRLLVVKEVARRRGIGSALVRAVEARCESAKLFTSTNASNAPMQHLLAQLGYVRSGVIENLDPGDPEWVYVRVLRAELGASHASASQRPHDEEPR